MQRHQKEKHSNEWNEFTKKKEEELELRNDEGRKSKRRAAEAKKCPTGTLTLQKSDGQDAHKDDKDDSSAETL